MKPKKSDIQKWVNALRSGKYSQTRGDLQNMRGFCCFGVACDLFIPKEHLVVEGDYMVGGNPDQQFSAPKWLKTLDRDFKNRTGYTPQVLNDHGFGDGHCFSYQNPLSFDEIADLLEAVYIHEVLS